MPFGCLLTKIPLVRDITLDIEKGRLTRCATTVLASVALQRSLIKIPTKKTFSESAEPLDGRPADPAPYF